MDFSPTYGHGEDGRCAQANLTNTLFNLKESYPGKERMWNVVWRKLILITKNDDGKVRDGKLLFLRFPD